MKHKKKKEREVKRTMNAYHGYLYRSIRDEHPLEGSIIFPIDGNRNRAFFVTNGSSRSNGLKVANEEGCVSHDHTVWFYYRASRREIQNAYAQYDKVYGTSLARNTALSGRVTAYDYGIGNV